ncbi:MAG: eCIS core domain-containing protein [Thermoanaerobaculia bacterium]
MPTPLQPKLVVNASGDRYEQEADHLAERVMRMPEPQAQHDCACGGECSRCKATRIIDEHPRLHHLPFRPVQTRPMAASGLPPTAAPPIVHAVLASAGQALDRSTRTFMELRFGHDFSRVRVHSGPVAEQSARELNAHAYTVGHDLVFGAGRFAPETHEGRNLIAHELTHVVQQSGSAGTRTGHDDGNRGLRRRPAEVSQLVQRKVVDDDTHLPCRALPGRSAAELTARENEAATLADTAAVVVRASPLSESVRALIWRRFRLDYNDPRTRCRFLPEIGDRFARIGEAIRTTDCTYPCTSTGEPLDDCGGALAVTDSGLLGGRRIYLCSRFWSRPDQQAITLLHEWAHYVFATRGLKDEPLGGFDNAECYNAFASELAGQPITGPEDANCVPNTRPLPVLDRGRLLSPCSNVFLDISAVGGYAYGLPGSHHYGTVGVGLDLRFPITRMHDWELGVGARYLRFAPLETNDRGAYLLGVRAALAFRYRPWRFGGQFGAHLEGGAIDLPTGTTGDRAHSYGLAGVSGGLNFPIGRQTALQLLFEVGGGVGFDPQNDQRFKWFQSGINAVFQFQ